VRPGLAGPAQSDGPTTGRHGPGAGGERRAPGGPVGLEGEGRKWAKIENEVF
jgi:hypothetical protein